MPPERYLRGPAGLYRSFLEDVPRRHSREPRMMPDLLKNGIWPQSIRSRMKHFEIFGAHLDVDLNRNDIDRSIVNMNVC